MAEYLIGISGVSRSGKDTLANIFTEKGYYCVSLGEIVRNIARDRHASDPNPIARENMTETSNWLRETKGTDFAIKEAVSEYTQAKQLDSSYKGLVLLSVRAPIEVDYILTHGGRLIWIEVSDQVRYHRAMTDLRAGEPKLSFEDYLAQEHTQYIPQPGIPKEIQMDMEYVHDHATDSFDNNGDDIKLFIQKGNELVDKLLAS